MEKTILEKKRLSIEVFPAWNSYAISMMSVLEHCGMWNKEDTFQKFLSVTGIASEFCVDATCSSLPVTDYDWMEDHACFMERIGVRTKKYYAAPGTEEYSAVQEEAVAAIKEGIEAGRACVTWGIDTGEFGVIYGYDDEDKVFFPKGIGSQNTNTSMPVLYSNLGKTFEWAPVLYCEIPETVREVDWNQAYTEALRLYVEGMEAVHENGCAYGLAAYDAMSEAVKADRLDSFGFKYCIGIYYERKEAILLYLEEMQKEQPSEALAQLIEAFRTTVDLYRKLMFDILGGGTEGWNSLFEPVNKECYPESVKIMQELKASEERNVELAKCVIEKII